MQIPIDIHFVITLAWPHLGGWSLLGLVPTLIGAYLLFGTLIGLPIAAMDVMGDLGMRESLKKTLIWGVVLVVVGIASIFLLR